MLANLLGVQGFTYESTAEVLAAAGVNGNVPADKLSNEAVANAAAAGAGEPVVASIYQLDSIVRRAPSLQLTADARRASGVATGEEALA